LVEIALPRRRRQLPVHADSDVVGVTPTRFEVLPAALRVIVGEPGPDDVCAWEPA
jgi:diacylglycerol kinase family enzyme